MSRLTYGLLLSAMLWCVAGAGWADTGITPLRPLLTLGGGQDSVLHQPSAAVALPDGGYLVLDGVSQRLQEFAADGRHVRSLGEEWGMRFPLGLSLDARGQRLFVADSGNGRVIVADRAGRVLSTLVLPRDGMTQAPDPTDVLLDEARNLLYVVDNDNHRLLIYDPVSFELKHQVGKMAVVDEGFRWPFSLALDRNGTVYLVDVINTVVRSLLPQENWRFGVQYGGWGVTRGKLFRPKGVAVDRHGLVYVSDSYLGVIQVFHPDGRFHSLLGNAQGLAYRFQTPVRLSFDGRGHLLVVEMLANQVRLFEVVR